MQVSILNSRYMNDISDLEKRFYKEIKNSIEHYSNEVLRLTKKGGEISALANDSERHAFEILQSTELPTSQLEALRHIIAYAATGVVHSLFVSIDGGTTLSDDGRALELIELKTGQPLTEGALHDNFFQVIAE